MRHVKACPGLDSLDKSVQGRPNAVNVFQVHLDWLDVCPLILSCRLGKARVYDRKERATNPLQLSWPQGSSKH